VYSIDHYVKSLSVTCDRSVIFSGDWNSVESGVAHHKTKHRTNQAIFYKTTTEFQNVQYIIAIDFLIEYYEYIFSTLMVTNPTNINKANYHF
jgi:hypothetical protein